MNPFYGRKFSAIISVTLIIVGTSIAHKRELFNQFDHKDKHSLPKVVSLTKWLHSVWISGDSQRNILKGKLVCSQFPLPTQLDQEFTKCNPEYIHCLISSKLNKNDELLFEKERFKFNFKNKKLYTPRKLASYGDETLRGHYEISFKTKNKIEHFIYLEDSCRDSYLLENHFAHGKYDSKKRDWTWDNVGRKIFVDKYPALDYLYKIWIDKSEPLTKKDFISVKNIGDVNNAEKYCSIHGGKLIESHVFDAASFFPTKREENFINYFRSSYVWNKNDPQDKKVKCSRMFSKSCLNESEYNIWKFPGKPSWIGLFAIHGGALELLRNPIHPSRDIFPSSFYYTSENDLQEIGSRLNWANLKDKMKIKTTFRCMKEIH